MFKRIVGLGFQTKGKNKKEVSEYINKLVQSGATEFFTGYNPFYWYEKFGFEVSPNGRFAEHEQITDIETLKEIVKEVHSHKLEIFVNLNAWYYTDITFPYIKKMIEEFIEIGIDGIICGNISILEYLKEINYTGKINISTILALYNTESIKFFLENYNINKIILSRELTLKEIEKIVTNFPDTKFEVFGEGDFCRYNNGLCFAEHKYSTRDICTVVVNDLIYKKRFRPDFKKIILDSTINSLDKIGYFDDKFQDIFDKISDIIDRLEIGIFDEINQNKLKEDLLFIYKFSKNRIDLFFDALSPRLSIKNKKILTYFKGLKYLLENTIIEDQTFKKNLEDLKKELEQSIRTGLEYFTKKQKELNGQTKLKILETNLFYSKGDNLNLYAYLFFDKFKNIETVKFPTRGRNYSEKLNTIKEVINSQELDKKKYIDRSISPERTHYDLTYLFGDKLWFRKMLNNNFIS